MPREDILIQCALTPFGYRRCVQRTTKNGKKRERKELPNHAEAALTPKLRGMSLGAPIGSRYFSLLEFVQVRVNIRVSSSVERVKAQIGIAKAQPKGISTATPQVPCADVTLSPFNVHGPPCHELFFTRCMLRIF